MPVEMLVTDLETPVPVIDLDRVEQNIARMQAYADDHGLALRPHIKTHKLPRFAKAQMAAGATGITCQKLGEAEVMADAGLADILISFPLIGAAKAARLAALAARAKMRVAVDNPLALDTAAEDPMSTFSRVAAMDEGLAAAGATDLFDFAILSDTTSPAIAAEEALWWARLVAERRGEGRIFYRRRTAR